MKQTNAENPSAWTRPVKRGFWWTAWLVLIAALTAIIWLIIDLTSNELYHAALPSRWLISFGLALAIAILLGLLARCLCSWRSFKRLLLGIACLAALAALFYAEEDIRGGLMWKRFKSHWEAKGEKFSFVAFIPSSIPDDQNFAMAPVVASTYLRVVDRNGNRKSPADTNVVDRLQMPLDVDNGGPPNARGNWQKAIPSNLEAWQRYYRNIAGTNTLFPVSEHPQSPAADVLLALSKYESTIEDLRKAAARPASRFPIFSESEQPFAILLPHLAPLKSCAVVLQVRAVAELQAGQSGAALADIRLALGLAEKIRPEPFLISHLVRIAMFQITEQAIWEGLAEHRWSDAQVAELDQRLAGLDFVADYQFAMRGENACDVATTDFLRHRPSSLDNLGEPSQDGSFRLGNLCGYLIPSGWFCQNELRTSQFMLEQFLPVANTSRQTFSPSLASEATQSLAAMPRTPYTVICRMLLPALTKSSHRFAFAQAALGFARCGCAMERYHLATGKYPEELATLEPQFIPKVPVDPIDGQPLRYRAGSDGSFILYSVGWNGTDDDGQVFLTRNGVVDLDKGDWAWRYQDSLTP